MQVRHRPVYQSRKKCSSLSFAAPVSRTRNTRRGTHSSERRPKPGSLLGICWQIRSVVYAQVRLWGRFERRPDGYLDGEAGLRALAALLTVDAGADGARSEGRVMGAPLPKDGHQVSVEGITLHLVCSAENTVGHLPNLQHSHPMDRVTDPLGIPRLLVTLTSPRGKTRGRTRFSC